MHELSLMQDLLSKIQKIASDAKAEKVTNVHVQLGALAHISPEHFKEHFLDMSKGSIAEKAALTITQNDDIHDPKAQDITLLSIDVAE